MTAFTYQKISIIELKKQSFFRDRISVDFLGKSFAKNKTISQTSEYFFIVEFLVAVVIGFFLCYAPLYFQRLIIAYSILIEKPHTESENLAEIAAHLYIISGITFYLGSVINPILYNVLSTKHRRAFKNLVFCRIRFSRKRSLKIDKSPRTIRQVSLLSDRRLKVNRSPLRGGLSSAINTRQKLIYQKQTNDLLGRIPKKFSSTKKPRKSRSERNYFENDDH